MEIPTDRMSEVLSHLPEIQAQPERFAESDAPGTYLQGGGVAHALLPSGHRTS